MAHKVSHAQLGLESQKLSCRQKRARFPDYTILRPSAPTQEIVKGRRGWGVPNSISI